MTSAEAPCSAWKSWISLRAQSHAAVLALPPDQKKAPSTEQDWRHSERQPSSCSANVFRMADEKHIKSVKRQDDTEKGARDAPHSPVQKTDCSVEQGEEAQDPKDIGTSYPSLVQKCDSGKSPEARKRRALDAHSSPVGVVLAPNVFKLSGARKRVRWSAVFGGSSRSWLTRRPVRTTISSEAGTKARRLRL